ncbi:MAG: hypothetical protein ACREXP_06770 [Steroidobacteraceae bacterium]
MSTPIDEVIEAIRVAGYHNQRRPGHSDIVSKVAKFQSLPRRQPGHTHVMGFDFVMIVPVFVDNVNPPSLCRQNGFGIDIDATYERMLATICRAYEARWHL